MLHTGDLREAEADALLDGNDFLKAFAEPNRALHLLMSIPRQETSSWAFAQSSVSKNRPDTPTLTTTTKSTAAPRTKKTKLEPQDSQRTDNAKKRQADRDAEEMCRNLPAEVSNMFHTYDGIHKALLVDAIHFELPRSGCTKDVALAHACEIVAQRAVRCVYKIGITHCLSRRWHMYRTASNDGYSFNRMVCLLVCDHPAVAGMAEASLIRHCLENVREGSACVNKREGGDTKVGDPPHFVYCVCSAG